MLNIIIYYKFVSTKKRNIRDVMILNLRATAPPFTNSDHINGNRGMLWLPRASLFQFQTKNGKEFRSTFS